jgi:hypothetical protein
MMGKFDAVTQAKKKKGDQDDFTLICGNIKDQKCVFDSLKDQSSSSGTNNAGSTFNKPVRGKVEDRY